MARKCALALVGEQRHLETTRKFLRFELQFGSPRCVESVAAARIAEAIVALKGQAARSGIFHRKIGRASKDFGGSRCRRARGSVASTSEMLVFSASRRDGDQQLRDTPGWVAPAQRERCSSGLVAGPSSTRPSMSKREPWHGQSQLRSTALKATWQPWCVQTDDRA
jgi:hypothetical protein